MTTERSIPDALKKAARWTVVSALVLSPWLFGSADPWAYLSVCLLISVGLAFWLLSLLIDDRPRLRAPVLTAVLIALLAFVLLQMTPVPESFASKASPLSTDSRQAQVQVFERIGAREFLPADLADNTGSRTISASPAATQRSLYLLVAYLGVFLVLANCFGKWREIRTAAAVVVASSFLMAVLAIIHKFSGSKDLLWFHVPRFGGAIFGPFTNPNHYAAHMNMALGLALGLLLAASLSSHRFRMLSTWRAKVAWLSSGEATGMTLLVFALVFMGASVCMSLSRGGITSMAAALGLAGILAGVWGGRRNWAGLVGAVALLVMAGVVWLGWEPVVSELGTLGELDLATNSRILATRGTLEVFRTAPITGCGFGSFQHVFPMFQEPRIQFGRWLHAHNDYAQLLAEGGLVGMLLVVLAGVALVVTVAKHFRGAAPEGRLMTCGLAVGVGAIAVHSAVDYSLHKPANAILLAALCGMMVASVHVRSKSKRLKRDTREENDSSHKTYENAPVG